MFAGLHVDEGGEEPEQPLVLSASSAYLGGVGEISATYKSESGSYDSNIRALVYIDGSYAGDAGLLPRTPPGPGEEDPGQSFTYDIPARNLGGYEVEFIIIDGGSTASTVLQLEVNASPLSDDYEFLKALWNGLFDRNPEGAEINAYLAGLGNGSITRSQVLKHVRTREEFITARDILLGHKTLHGQWQELPVVLENTDQEGYGISGAGGVDSAAAQAAMGMPYTPADGNESDLGFYEGVEDDHGNLVSNGTWIGMNSIDVMAVISRPLDLDTFKIKSQNLADEGSLTISLNRAPFGTVIPCRLFSGSTNEFGTLSVHFTDGSFIDIESIEQEGVFAPRFQLGRIMWDLTPYQNVDFYSFKIGRILVNFSNFVAGGVVFSTFNSSYLDQDQFPNRRRNCPVTNRISGQWI